MRAKVIRVDPEHPDPGVIHQAGGLLRRGGLVAFPTETVYGLGANLEDPQAISELYQVKERPFQKQFTLHIADPAVVENHGVRVSPLARRLMARFWPGPLTLVLSRPDGSTLGFRMPSGEGRLANTTPGTEELFGLLARMVREGVRTAALEVSSHALDQKRVFGLQFELALFTQPSRRWARKPVTMSKPSMRPASLGISSGGFCKSASSVAMISPPAA